MKILFVLRQNKPSDYSTTIKSGLLNSATFISNFLKEKLGHETKVVVVFDGNGINKEIHSFKPNVVILEAIWCPPYKLQELSELHPKVKWIVRVHSKTPFLANEGIALEWLNQYNKIKNTLISFNSLETNRDYLKLGYKAIYLPNIYFVNKFPLSFIKVDIEFKKNIKHNVPYAQRKNILHVGCFGAIRPMKNHLNQAIAAIEYADKVNRPLFFHINMGRLEQKGEQVLKNLRALFANSKKHHLIEWGWLSHHEFNYLITKMEFGMQVSFSESFNIVSADFVANNIPIVVSKDITWMPFLFRANATNTESIVNKISVMRFFPRITKWLNKLALFIYNYLNSYYWEQFFGKVK